MSPGGEWGRQAIDLAPVAASAAPGRERPQRAAPVLVNASASRSRGAPDPVRGTLCRIAAAGKPRSDYVVKTDVEELSPTRVRLTIEVPFDELKQSLDHAYREIGRQVKISGFRPGHVPRQVLDLRVGRGAVLEHAINEAVPDFYTQAVRE